MLDFEAVGLDMPEVGVRDGKGFDVAVDGFFVEGDASLSAFRWIWNMVLKYCLIYFWMWVPVVN